MALRPPISHLFPYTTLFRSRPAPVGRHLAQHLDQRSEMREAPPRSGRLRDIGLGFGERVPEARAGARGRALQTFDRGLADAARDRKSTRLNSSHVEISYAVF